MTRKNVYINDTTREIIEEVMATHKIKTHTEAVRFIVESYQERDLPQEMEIMKKKQVAMSKELSTILNLSVYMAESMSATKHDKRTSQLYHESTLQVENDIKQHTSQSRLMFNE